MRANLITAEGSTPIIRTAITVIARARATPRRQKAELQFWVLSYTYTLQFADKNTLILR